MDKIDTKILEAINTISTESFVSSVNVNEILGLNATELGDRLKLCSPECLDFIYSDLNFIFFF